MKLEVKQSFTSGNVREIHNFLHELCPDTNIQEDYTKHLSVALTIRHQHTLIVIQSLVGN